MHIASDDHLFKKAKGGLFSMYPGVAYTAAALPSQVDSGTAVLVEGC